ncbi:RNA-dependent RNA polymerase [Klebsormidium nitens]|uniref:RNA-dependent RNA polymerase n=1 Tax=Klebsormidium nitens TaxID=105231 RepID=A0A1Y1HQC0_KLENI|nr:RNA-dependent RNA polymerase [Klebsormidium nitens]|eukprot:GAQ80834.1 RNA-dependent RNA polymerase [Klebsormidium nitens]
MEAPQLAPQSSAESQIDGARRNPAHRTVERVGWDLRLAPPPHKRTIQKSAAQERLRRGLLNSEQSSMELLPPVKGGQLRVGVLFECDERCERRLLWASEKGEAGAQTVTEKEETSLEFFYTPSLQTNSNEGEGSLPRKQIKLRFSTEITTVRAIELGNGSEVGFLVESKHAPLVYEISGDENGFKKRFTRTVDFTPGVALAKSNTYDFTLPRSPQNEAVLNGFFGFSNELDWVKPPLQVDGSVFPEAVPPEGSVPPLSPNGDEALYLEPQVDSSILQADLPFDVLWLLNALLQAGLLLGDRLKGEFLELVTLLVATGGEELVVVGLGKLFAQGKRIWDPTAALSRMTADILSLHTLPPRRAPPPPHTVLVYRLVITPCRAFASLPVAEPSNRLLRSYPELSKEGRFLRVSFRDEDGGLLSGGPLKSRERNPPEDGWEPRSAVYDRFSKIDFLFGGRRYRQLATSASQVCGFSFWAFAEEDLPGSVSRDQIRSAMGDFDGIREAAKHAVRPGLVLSTTIPTVTLKEDEVVTLDEVVRHGLSFADGCGRVSPDLAEMVAAKLPGVENPKSVAAFQIRFGGCKGMLQVFPPWAGRNLVGIRPSMDKFQSDHRTIEVISWASAPKPAFLGRQLIQLLEARGIPARVFETLQAEHLRTFDDVMLTGRTTAPLRALVGARSPAAALLAPRPGASSDALSPFQCRVVARMRERHVSELRDRARIYVPDGALVLGVVDELRVLAPGQIFVSLSGRGVVTGRVIVYRNPGLHPGDVRVLRAVDCPELHHVENVVVFSVLGRQRPESVNLTNGDLDGDRYWVFWDQRLVPDTSLPPFKYESSPPMPPEDRNLTVQDDRFFQLKHRREDNLGAICVAHMALCDARPRGANDPDCARLAQMAFDASNFVKSGFSVVLPAELRPRAYPDFMQKRGEESYASQNALGKLFRALDTAEWNRAAFYPADVTHGPAPADEAEFRDVSVSDARLNWARGLKAEYDSSVLELMDTYGLQAQEDLIVGAASFDSAGTELDGAELGEGEAEAEDGDEVTLEDEEGKMTGSDVEPKGRGTCLEDENGDMEVDRLGVTEVGDTIGKMDLGGGRKGRRSETRSRDERTEGEDVMREAPRVGADTSERPEFYPEKSGSRPGVQGRKGGSGSGTRTAQSRKEKTERQERVGAAFEALLAHFRERLDEGPPVSARENEDPSKKPKLEERHLNAAACYQATYGTASAEAEWSGGTAFATIGGIVYGKAEAERIGGTAGDVKLRGFWEVLARPHIVGSDACVNGGFN